MRKQSSAIYIQMNFCGSYSFVCEYGLLLRSDCHPKVSGNPGIFYSTKCAAMREILKNKDIEKEKKEGVPSVVAVVRPKIIRVVNLARNFKNQLGQEQLSCHANAFSKMRLRTLFQLIHEKATHNKDRRREIFTLLAKLQIW